MDADLRACAPKELGKARAIAHRAVQLLTGAARSNLAPQADDSHSNLGWDGSARRFHSRPLSGRSGDVLVGLSLSPLRLDIVDNGQAAASLELAGVGVGDAWEWLDLRLSEHGLRPATQGEIPYELPPEVAAIDVFSTDGENDRLGCLANWFGLAEAHLTQFATDHSALSPGPVRCWPHHFDIATYVQLEAGDFETAKGIGVGMSPGDESYDQPYFYINPWPHMDPGRLPGSPLPGHWHTEGFVGAIATGEEVLTLEDISQGLPAFVKRAFDIGREQLGL